MSALAGKNTRLAFDITSAWGTEAAVTTLMPYDSINFNKSVEPIDGVSPNGLAQIMLGDKIRGRETVTPSFTTKMGYLHGWEYLVAQLFGTSGAPTEQNASQGDYLHQITLNTALNAKYLCGAVKDSSGTVTTWPSIVVTAITIDYPNPPDVPVITFDCLASEEKLDSSTNTASVLNALTAPTINPAVVDVTDEFLINAQGGSALASPTDRVEVSSLRLRIERPQVSVSTIKGSAGTADPDDDGLILVTLGVNLRRMEDHTWLTAANNETAYKASFTIDGSQIGTGDNYSVAFFLPNCKIVEHPSRDITGPGFNSFDFTLESFYTASAPSGMDSNLPYIETTNTLSTSLLA